MPYSDRIVILRCLGSLLLLAGIVAAFLGPVEMFCFYLFSEGGPFHYDGFGFGSFMFANIAWQIIGYYAIAIVLIPLGYGHLAGRRWARALMVTALTLWLVFGAPLSLLFLMILVASKELAPWTIALACTAALLLYPVTPLALLRFYRGTNVRETFDRRDSRTYWTDAVPQRARVAAGLCVFSIVMLHLPIFLKGLFPVFGIWFTGLKGIVVAAMVVLSLVAIVCGIVRGHRWAWRSAILLFGALTVSVVITFTRSAYADILALLAFPEREMEFLEQIPVQGTHLAAFFGVPLLVSLGMFIRARP